MIEAKFYFKEGKEVQTFCNIYKNNILISKFDFQNSIKLNQKDNRITENIKENTKLTFFENEIYFYFQKKYFDQIDALFSENIIDKVSFNGKNELLFYIRSFCKKNKIPYYPSAGILSEKFHLITSVIKSILISIIGAFYISFFILLYRNKKKQTDFHRNKFFSLIHSIASYNKIHKIIRNDSLYFFDSFKMKISQNENHLPFFSIFNLSAKLSNLYLIPTQSIILSFKIFIVLKKLYGSEAAALILIFFSKRIPHFIYVKKSYENIFLKSKATKFYSGERESRYGILAMSLRNKNKISAIAIPHGMAYSYNFPLGIYGDKYYATTQEEADFLQKKYPEKEIIFNENVLMKMFSFNLNKKEKGVVFFTEPRRIEVNIKIITLILASLPTLRIKLHPADNKRNYIQFKNLDYIEDFSDSISNNICIARKSTILIEALYNKSTPIAVLFDKQDKFDFENIFPALNSKGVNKVFTKQQLELILESHKSLINV